MRGRMAVQSATVLTFGTVESTQLCRFASRRTDDTFKIRGQCYAHGCTYCTYIDLRQVRQSATGEQEGLMVSTQGFYPEVRCAVGKLGGVLGPQLRMMNIRSEHPQLRCGCSSRCPRFTEMKKSSLKAAGHDERASRQQCVKLACRCPVLSLPLLRRGKGNAKS